MKYINKLDSSTYEKVRNYLSKTAKEVGSLHVFSFEMYYLLYYMKYVIEKNNLNYQSIIKGETKELFDILKHDLSEVITIRTSLKYIEENGLYKLLKLVAFEDYEIDSYNDRVLDSLIDPNKQYLFVFDGLSLPYLPYSNVDIYDERIRGRVFNKYSPRAFVYIVYDKILGIKRDMFISDEEVRQKKYDAIIFLNNKRSYVDAIEYISNKNLRVASDIIAIQKYKYISKFRRTSALLYKIKSIIIDSDKAYLNYKKNLLSNAETDDINIKDVTLVNSNQLEDILKSNDNIPGISTNVTHEDLVKHNFRIGISTYENNDEHNRILQLIDRNEAITERIHELDEKISYLIDELIVR